jgi:hypothetical protein
MTTTPRRRNRSAAPITPDEAAARDFLKKFKNVLEADLRYQKYFEANDKAITYFRIKGFYKLEVLTTKHTEKELVNALHVLMTKGWVMSNSKLTEAYDYKVTRISPLD